MEDTAPQNGGPHSVFELINRGLDDVRRRVDETLVRLDVGDMNVRGEVHNDLERAVNMALLAKSRLLHTGQHFGAWLGLWPEDDHEHIETADGGPADGDRAGRHARAEETKE